MSGVPDVTHLRVANFLSFAACLAVNFLFNGILSPYDPDFPEKRSTNIITANKYDTLITPAGVGFAIWGAIYGFLLLFVLYTSVVGFCLRGKAKRDCDALLWRIG